MTRPLNIGVTCYPTFGGSGIIATEIAAELARRGHRVHVISYDLPVRLDRTADNVFFHEVEVREYPLFQHTPYVIALASRLVDVTRWERLDLLHVHYAVPHATSAFLAQQVLGDEAPKLVTTLHGTDITLVGGDPSYLPITRFSVMRSDLVTAPSEFLREASYERLELPRSTPIDVIPNFVDTDRYAPPVSRDPHRLRQLFRCSAGLEGARVLLHVSNFRPVKRVLDVVAVFAQVARARPCVLLLVGDGPDRAAAEARVRELGLADRVSFVGKQESFVAWMQQSDVFLLPSETESFGLAALEAMSCGVPVVGSHTGGLTEVVTPDVGFLHPVGDVEAMAASVVRLLDDADLHERMGGAARRAAVARWRMGPMVDRYEEAYRRLLG
ncbi:MAG: N-acetyl-alpha-D-glucosaminyl L-malate synthase BshA [Myxococcales bacterium]